VDSEKFDKIVLDLLYDELDELTRASAVRYTEQSARAKALYSELRATKEVGAMPLVDPPSDLERNILDAEARVRAGRPLAQRLGTLVSIVAGYAMRPQLAMAALLLLMVGSSLLFLRVKPGEPSSVQVTERGVPESDREQVAVVPAPAASAVAELEPPRPAPARARSEGRAATPGADEKAKSAAPADEIAAAPAGAADQAPENPYAGAGAAHGALGEASGDLRDSESKKELARDDERPARRASTCEAERARYDEAAARDPSTANDAKWDLARCYDATGRTEQARSSYTALLTVPSYADRARKALDVLSVPQAHATRAAAAKAAAKPPAAASPATTTTTRQ
jgi:hypothetical protein